MCASASLPFDSLGLGSRKEGRRSRMYVRVYVRLETAARGAAAAVAHRRHSPSPSESLAGLKRYKDTPNSNPYKQAHQACKECLCIASLSPNVDCSSCASSSSSLLCPSPWPLVITSQPIIWRCSCSCSCVGTHSKFYIPKYFIMSIIYCRSILLPQRRTGRHLRRHPTVRQILRML